MKRLSEQVSLEGTLEEITISEFRQRPGEVLASVQIGKTYVITKAGKAVTVLSRVPGVQLSMNVLKNGEIKYKL